MSALRISWKAVLRRVLLGLSVLLIVLISSVALLIGSDTGTQLLLSQVEKRIAGLSLDGVSGRLVGPLELEQVSYRDDQGTDIQLGAIGFDWKPMALFSRRVEISRFSLAQGRLALPPADPEQQAAEDTQKGGLPDRIQLPVSVVVHALDIGPLEIVNGESVQRIDRIELDASAEGDTGRLSHFYIRHPQGELSVQGNIALAKPYALDLTSDIRFRPPNASGGEVVLSGELKGDLERLAVTQSASGLIDAQLRAHVDSALGEDPQWSVALELIDAQLSELDPALAQTGLSSLAANLDASGGLAQANLEGQVRFEQQMLGKGVLDLSAKWTPSLATLASSTLELNAGETRLAVNGEVEGLNSPAPSVNARLQWEGGRYPLQGESVALRSPQGELLLSGPFNNLNTRINTVLQAVEIGKVSLKGQAQVSPSGADKIGIEADLLGGRVLVDGKAGWADETSWQLKLEAQQVQPGLQWPDLDGELNSRLAVEGRLDPALYSRVHIQSLGGQLKGQPLSGGGQVVVQGAAIDVSDLQLGWGEAQLAAAGRIDEQLDLNWSLDLPSLDSLLPQARGALRAKGTLAGSRVLPRVDAQLSAQNLRVNQLRLNAAEGQVAFDASWKHDADIQLSARGLALPGQSIEQIDLSLKGPQQALVTLLSVDSDKGGVELQIEGSASMELPAWRYKGYLQRLALSPVGLNPWQLEEPAAIDLGSKRYRLALSCLVPEALGGQVCVNLDHQPAVARTDAELEVQALPLTVLASFLPPSLLLDGELEANGGFRQRGDAISYRVNARLPRAQIDAPDTDLTLGFDGSVLELTGDSDAVKGRLDVPLSGLDGQINGNFNIKDPAGTQSLAGQVKVDLPDLRPLGVLSPGVVIDKGRADVNVAVAGTLAAPRIQGDLQVTEGVAEIAAAGIRIEDAQLRLSDDPERKERMQLTGSLNSGDGSLALDGFVEPLAGRIELALRGDQFTAMNTQEVLVNISPDMAISGSPDGVRVTGELNVPRALIQPPKLGPSSVDPSADLVVKRDGEPEDVQVFNTELDLRIVLGDDVRVDAFGFDGYLTGALTLEQSAGSPARGTGRVGVRTGEYTLYGQQLQISRGSVLFTGGPLTNPGLDLRVAREVDDVSVGALVGGTLRNPALELTSSPAMPDNRILSYLLLGRAPGSASASEQELLMKMALSLATKGGNNLVQNLQGALNVDELGISSGDTAEDTSLYVAKHLSPDLYIKYGIGLVEPINTFLIHYQLTDRWFLETETSGEASGGDLIYSFER
jgi:translocation and assembly module TamB